ncbi:MAG: hypothetical protein JNK21_15220 [Rhodospirillaceae bacterium]|nr:hypothetical protein [Rhodospirillaceae bacterium]
MSKKYRADIGPGQYLIINFYDEEDIVRWDWMMLDPKTQSYFYVDGRRVHQFENDSREQILRLVQEDAELCWRKSEHSGKVLRDKLEWIAID